MQHHTKRDVIVYTHQTVKKDFKTSLYFALQNPFFTTSAAFVFLFVYLKMN